MNPQRRLWLQQLAARACNGSTGLAGLGGLAALGWQQEARAAAAAGVAPPTTDAVRRDRPLQFPRDHGAHLAQRTEWWYATGWSGTQDTPRHGWQVTFFRSATGLAATSRSRFAPRHLLFAHAAVTDLAAQQHRHAQRMARWSGLPDAAPDTAALDQGLLQSAGWSLRDTGASWQAQVVADDFALDLNLGRTQALLLQGEAGYSLKGPPPDAVAPATAGAVARATPAPPYASHYYSEPQLAAQGQLAWRAGAAGTTPVSLAQNTTRLQGRAWLDHEWSDSLLPPQAVGWDWVGFNLFDGSALTAFQLRQADGRVVWAGGSWRAGSATGAAGVDADRLVRNFQAPTVTFTPGTRWRSGRSGANYPIFWTLNTPAGRFEVSALLPDQELDSSASTGSFYWEGLSQLLDAAGRRVGLGYLEMTGYAGRLRLG